MDNSTNFPWSSETLFDETGQWRQVNWKLTALGLSEALHNPDIVSPSRAQLVPLSGTILLLSDVITLDDNLASLSLLTGPEPHLVDSLFIEARLTFEREPNWPLYATLQWGEHILNAVVETSRAIFHNIPFSSLISPQGGRALSDLHISIERRTVGSAQG